MIEIFLNLFIIQALMGAFDTLYHHELKVALAQRINARLELYIHAVRAVLYGILFVGLAWFEWHGFWVILLIGIVLIEVGLTLWDFVVEDKTRLLPSSERITHTLLAINGGALFLLIALILPRWYVQDTTFVLIDYGWRSWFLFFAGIGVTLSGLRDAFAAWQLQRLDLKLNLDLGKGHKRLLISGGTGFIGSALCHELIHAGHDITLVTRNPLAASMQFFGRIRAVRACADLSDQEQFDIIINLAGAPVVGPPWTTKRKTLLLNSRLHCTRELLNFVKRAQQRPEVWIQASAIGYYGTKTEQPVTEINSKGNGFAADLCGRWEQTTEELENLSVRRVILRFGLVFGRSGGSLPTMMLPFRFGFGAILGDGHQHVSWIHIEDLLQIIALSIANQAIHGKINVVAPDCPTYSEFTGLVGQILLRPVWLRFPTGFLRKILGEMASLFVDGPIIKPERLERIHYQYRFPRLRAALMDLL